MDTSSSPNSADNGKGPADWASIIIRFVDDHPHMLKYICTMPISEAVKVGCIMALERLSPKTRVMPLCKCSLALTPAQTADVSAFLTDSGSILVRVHNSGAYANDIIYHSELEEWLEETGLGENIVRGLHDALIKDIRTRNERNSSIIDAALELEEQIDSQHLALDQSPETYSQGPLTMSMVYGMLNGRPQFPGSVIKTRDLIKILCEALGCLPDLPFRVSKHGLEVIKAWDDTGREQRDSITRSGEWRGFRRSEIAAISHTTFGGLWHSYAHRDETSHLLLVSGDKRLFVYSSQKAGDQLRLRVEQAPGYSSDFLTKAFADKKVSREQILSIIRNLIDGPWGDPFAENKNVQTFLTLMRCFKF